MHRMFQEKSHSGKVLFAFNYVLHNSFSLPFSTRLLYSVMPQPVISHSLNIRSYLFDFVY